MEKILCIKCNSQLWKYINPYLIEWNYDCDSYIEDNFDKFPILIINNLGNIGECNNVSIDYVKKYNRELVTNVEEFLERAAKLKGFTYIRKDIIQINGIEIKPGMIISTSSEILWIVFPIKNELAVVSYYSNSWYLLKSFIKFFKEDIEVIYDLSTGDSITSGTILWEKSKEIVITKEQVAEKFNVPIKYLKIV